MNCHPRDRKQQDFGDEVLFVEDGSNDLSCYQRNSRFNQSTDQQLVSPALLPKKDLPHLYKFVKHQRSLADLDLNDATSQPSMSPTTIPLSTDKEPFAVADSVDHTQQSRQTSRVTVDGGVGKHGGERRRPEDGSMDMTVVTSIVDSARQQVATVKKKAFNNITYSPSNNQNKRSWKTILRMQGLGDDLSKLNNLTHGDGASNANLSPDQAHKLSSRRSKKSKRSNKSRESPYKTGVDKENANHRTLLQDNSLITLDSNKSESKEKLSSLSPTKFERFVQLSNSVMKNPFIQRKQSHASTFPVDSQREFCSGVVGPRKHFTKSAIYHERAQITERTKQNVNNGESEKEPCYTNRVQQNNKVSENDVAIKIGRVYAKEEDHNDTFDNNQKSSTENEEYENSPDNIVKRLIRRTNKSKERHRNTYRRHLAQKIAESSAQAEEKLVQEQPEKQVLSEQNQKVNESPAKNHIISSSKHISPSRKLYDFNLKVITEESQTQRQEDLLNCNFQEQTLIQHHSQSNSWELHGTQSKPLQREPPIVISQQSSEQDFRSLTFTELEMHVQEMQKQEDQVQAKLDELIVPDVPKVLDAESGSMNTDRIFQTYKHMLNTSNNCSKQDFNLETIKSYDSREILRDSLDGASPRQNKPKTQKPQENQIQMACQNDNDQRQQILKNYNSDIHALKRPSKQLIQLTSLHPQITSEESPSNTQLYLGSASYHLTSRYGLNPKPVDQQVQSCHIHEEKFYMKEIDKLKDELNDLKIEETEIMQNSQEKVKINNICKLIDEPSQFIEKDIGYDQEEQDSLDQQCIQIQIKPENKNMVEAGNDDQIKEVGIGLFQNQAEYDQINEMQDFNHHDELISSQSDPEPALNIIPQAIIQTDSQLQSPAAALRQEVYEQSIIEEQEESLPYSSNDDYTDQTKNAVSPPTKKKQCQKILGLNLVSLMNPIKVQEVVTLQNSPEKLSDRSMEFQILQCNNENHDHSKDLEDFRIQTIPIEFKELMGEDGCENQFEIKDEPMLNTREFKKIDFEKKIHDVELESPHSFVLNLHKIISEQKLSPVKSNRKKKSISPIRSNFKRKDKSISSISNTQPFANQKQQKPSPSKKANLFNSVKQTQIKEPKEINKGPVVPTDEQTAKRQRRSRKSRSGSTTTTKLSQMIKNNKETMNHADIQNNCNTVNNEIINDYKFDTFQGNKNEIVNQIQVQAPQDMKSPEAHEMFAHRFENTQNTETTNMFDQRFENTDQQSTVSKQSSVKNPQGNNSLMEEQKNPYIDYKVGRKSCQPSYVNSKSQIQSPNKTEDFLMNPQIIDSRNAIRQNNLNQNKSNDATLNIKMQSHSDNQHLHTIQAAKAIEHLSQQSSTSRSSLFNSQMLKQQKEPVDDDYKMDQNVVKSVPCISKNTTDKSILNIQSQNNRTEIELIEDYKLDEINDFKHDEPSTGRIISQAKEMMIKDNFLDEGNEQSGFKQKHMSARKAAIMHAESLLQSNVTTNQSVDDQNAQTIQIAQSIKNKRKMDSVFVFGKNYSSKEQRNPENQMKSDISSRRDSSSPYQLPKTLSDRHTPLHQKSNFSMRINKMAAQTSFQQQNHIHQRSQYCEEFNIQSARNNQSSSNKKQQVTSSMKNTSSGKQIGTSTNETQPNVSQQNLRTYLNHTKSSVDRPTSDLNQRRFKNNQGQNLKVITNVSEMQRITSTIKQRIKDKYSAKNVQNSSHKLTTSASRLSNQHNASKSALGQKSLERQQNASEVEPWSSDKTYQLTSFDNSVKPSQPQNKHQKLNGNYFIKPQDLRSKSNSNIGCGVYQSRRSTNRSSISLNGKVGTPNFENKQQLGEKRSLNSTQQLNQTAKFHLQKVNTPSYYMKSTSSTTQIAAKNFKATGARCQPPAINVHSKKEMPAYCRPTNSFAQKKNTLVTPIQGNSKSPMRRVGPMTTTSQHTPCKNQLKKPDEQNFNVEQLIQNELEAQGYASSFVVISNNIKQNAIVQGKSRQQSLINGTTSQDEQSCQRSQNQPTGNENSTTPTQFCKQVGGQKSFNMIRRSQIMRKQQRNSPRKSAQKLLQQQTQPQMPVQSNLRTLSRFSLSNCNHLYPQLLKGQNAHNFNPNK